MKKHHLSPTSSVYKSNRSRPALKAKHTGGEAAFFLPDLLVGAAIGSLLVASLGGLALISEIRYNRNALASQNLHLKWSRSLAFISNEAQQAHWISTEPSLPMGYPCSGGTPANTLVLDGPPRPDNPAIPTWRIVYGVRANGTDSKQWKGVNRLVRCGPSFESKAREDSVQQETASSDLAEAAVRANLSSGEGYQETFLTDQLAPDANVACPNPNDPGTCQQPFHVRLFNSRGERDRSALINLFLKIDGGAIFPLESSGRFHAQLFAFRAPGFSTTADPSCLVQVDPSAGTGNAEPPNIQQCQTQPPLTGQPILADSSSRRINNKSYNISTGSGSYRINACGPTCDGPLTTDVNDIIYLNAPFSDYTTMQFSPTDTRPCGRQSCFLNGNGQRVHIFDGNVLVFTDRVVRL
jgi:hypothetical protein